MTNKSVEEDRKIAQLSKVKGNSYSKTKHDAMRESRKDSGL